MRRGFRCDLRDYFGLRVGAVSWSQVRELFLFLSHQKHLRRWMESSRLGTKLSHRFVAGLTLDQALAVARRIYTEGLTVTLDHLGENVSTAEEAAASREECCEGLVRLAEAGLEPNVSIKLTQFGLDLDPQLCRDNAASLVSLAAGRKGFVRVDMESSEYTDRTIEIVTDLHARYGSVGTVIQAYLLRSEADVKHLSERGVRIRLCKGAYLEPQTIAYVHKPEVDRNYQLLMEYLLQNGTYPALATHDERLILAALKFAADRHIAPERFEFQMLYGVRRDLQRRLEAGGYRVRLYLPYGVAWYPYFMRRLAERPANVIFLARNLLR